jgi:hypothetical protein
MATKTLLAAALVYLCGFPGVAAAALTVESYSTTVASWYSIKDTSYSGNATTSYPFLTYTAGTGNLTDGIANDYVAWIGENSFPGGSTLGHPRITVDLGSNFALSQVSLYFLVWQPASISLPSELHVSYSQDGVTYSDQQNLAIDPGSVPNNFIGNWVNFQLNGTGRFLQLVLDNPGSDTFMGEMQFNGVAPVPEPSTYIAGSLCAGLLLVSCLRRRNASPKASTD